LAALEGGEGETCAHSFRVVSPNVKSSGENRGTRDRQVAEKMPGLADRN
jgi:hypothetical protein